MLVWHWHYCIHALQLIMLALELILMHVTHQRQPFSVCLSHPSLLEGGGLT